MIRSGLRQVHPSLLAAAGATVVATAGILAAAGVVQRWLDARGTSECMDPNECYPAGSALDAVLGMELIAAFVPALLGLLLGVPLFTGRRADDRGRRVLVALGVGVVCAAVVAVTHRLVATRYTLLANDTYELLQLLHLNNVGFMVAQTALLTTLAGVLGLSTGGRRVRTLLLTVAGWPFGFIVACGGVALLAGPLSRWSDDTPPERAGTFAGDVSLTDPLGYLAAGILACCVFALLLLTRRLAARVPG